MQQTETHITKPFPEQDRDGEQYFVIIEQLLTPGDREVVRVRSYRQARFRGAYGTVITNPEITGDRLYHFPTPQPPLLLGQPVVSQWANKEVYGLSPAQCQPNPHTDTYQDWLAWSEAYNARPMLPDLWDQRLLDDMGWAS